MIELVPEDVLPELDAHVLANRKLRGLNLLRDAAGLSLKDSLVAYADRYAELRRDAPERFAEDHEAYWAGFYS